MIFKKLLITDNIIDAIVSAADKSIPNKIVTVKCNGFPWIICHIKSLI